MNIQQLKSAEEAFVAQSESLFRQFFEKTMPFRNKCKENEHFWRSDHWYGKPQKPNEPYPSVPALFSAIESLHAEIMDNCPEAVLMPYEKNDKHMADMLSTLVNTALYRCNFIKKYRRETLRMLKNGCCCFSVIWNSSLYNGYGDIDVTPCDMRYFVWDPAYDNIQDGRSVFRFGFYDKEWFKEHYPEKYSRIESQSTFSDVSAYNFTYDVNPSSGIMLIERWYKKYDPESDRYIVHTAKIAGGVLLEWSEYNEATKQNGVYADGLYPFVIMPLFDTEDSPVGMGMIDIFRSEQEYIDALDRIILKNAMLSSKVRLLKDNRCNIPKEKLANWEEDVLEGSDISERSIRWIQPQSISPMIQEHLSFKINTLKKDSGQTEFIRGENSSGVTSASAILALQNAANKRARNIIGKIYDSYSEIIQMMLSRIAQFYDDARTVRIIGSDNCEIEYYDPNAIDGYTFYKLDIKIRAQKKNPYEVMYNNDIAGKLKELDIITDEEMISLMNFEGKEIIENNLRQRKEQNTQQNG